MQTRFATGTFGFVPSASIKTNNPRQLAVGSADGKLPPPTALLGSSEWNSYISQGETAAAPEFALWQQIGHKLDAGRYVHLHFYTGRRRSAFRHRVNQAGHRCQLSWRKINSHIADLRDLHSVTVNGNPRISAELVGKATGQVNGFRSEARAAFESNIRPVDGDALNVRCLMCLLFFAHTFSALSSTPRAGMAAIIDLSGREPEAGVTPARL